MLIELARESVSPAGNGNAVAVLFFQSTASGDEPKNVDPDVPAPTPLLFTLLGLLNGRVVSG